MHQVRQLEVNKKKQSYKYFSRESRRAVIILWLTLELPVLFAENRVDTILIPM